MKYLFLLAVLLIGYGSLYPFDFRAQGAPLGALFEFGSTTRGDFLGNLALFLPFGYLGMVAWSRPGRLARFVIVVVLGAVYGTALQWLQLYLPSRDPAVLRDVVPNIVGTVVGALAGMTPLLDVRRLGERGGTRPAPWVLVCFWLAYRLVPFVPSIDLQAWKDSLKPLRDWRPLPWISVVHDAAAWTAVGCLWAAAPLGRLSVRWLPVLVLATLGLEVLIVDNRVSPGNVAGAALGLALSLVLARRPGPVAVLLAAAILLAGLRPGEGAAGGFEWVPFGGFLSGSMLVNAQSLFEKAFLYGALVWLAREAGLRLALAAGSTALLLAGIEVAQTGIPGHTAEVTDPLLALFAALFLWVADPPRPPSIPVESPQRSKEDL